MTPEELAARHPLLYHLADPLGLEGILRYGLLPTSTLLTLYEVPAHERAAIERRRRPKGVRLSHALHGTALIADNSPLNEKALASCLDDRLSPEDWMLLLNRRVFFWPDQQSLADHLAARLIRGRERLVLVLDTLSLARRYLADIELAAINTGSTLRKPARRGLATFTRAPLHSYDQWRRLRGGRDRLRELTVVGGVRDIADHLVRHYLTPGQAVAGKDGSGRRRAA